MEETEPIVSVKRQVVDNIPKRIRELKFGILSNQDIVNQGVVEVSTRAFYDITNESASTRQVVSNGPLDGRMGTSSKDTQCKTCGQVLKDCNGHFGYVRLALPAFHIGYLKRIITILQCICKECSRVLLPEKERRAFLRSLRGPNIDQLRRTQICKKIHDECKKSKQCFHCGAYNGQVKKAGQGLKITHDKFKVFRDTATGRRNPPRAKLEFDDSFKEAKKGNPEVNKNIKKALDDLDPLRVLKLFRRVIDPDCELLGIDPTEGRPEMFIWQYVPAPPVCIRPSVSQDLASTEDDITTKLSDIVYVNSLIRKGLREGQSVANLMEQWAFLQLQIAMYVNSDVPGLQDAGLGKTIRGFCQRLKGKQGRFRGNLSGKRVDFSGRTVISPDPNLSINEVAVPELVAKNLTYPERVTDYNKEKLQERVRNGIKKWPGANYIRRTNSETGEETVTYLKYGHPDQLAKSLNVGDVVERHLEDGDIVLFNRQPSLHKLSILCHFAKIRPFRTFRLNECVCNPYNADFDGDEMNLHVPQTEEARTEARELMGVQHNLATPKNGEPIIAAIQDFISAAYLLSGKDVFYDRAQFSNICMMMMEQGTTIDLPAPAVLKPEMLWTGKQVFNILMRPNLESPVLVNLDAACRGYKPKDGVKDENINDTWLCVRNSEVMCGVMDKSTVGSGKKDSVFYVILRDYGPAEAVLAMNRISKLCARWLASQGFSIGISDVTPTSFLVHMKHALVERAYKKVDEIIDKFKNHTLEKAAGCTEEETMENEISGVLSKVRTEAGDACIAGLSKWNSPLIMATSGSKGSAINVSQMVAVVGQQIIGGKRVADGFQDRSLPHFPKNARQPPSKGFVRNSFYSGLTPTEFLFHAISGREGLVDTAVKTAETGYMSRRLMKSLEDLSTKYDDTVRNSSGTVVQFQYGDDKLDPVDMEGKAKPVNFERTYNHIEAITWDNKHPSLLPSAALALSHEILMKERAKLTRKSIFGEVLDFDDQSDAAVDHLQSARDFVQSVEDFVCDKIQRMDKIRRDKGLEPDDPTTIQACKLSEKTLVSFLKTCMYKYKKAQVEYEHAVGAVGAHSIGEPGTQMTLKTFHFAGVAGMSITQGVPRIKEIINASKEISTPVIKCNLVNENAEMAARVVKGRIEKTFVGDIAEYVEDVWAEEESYISVMIDFSVVKNLQLEVDMTHILRAIKKHKLFKADDLTYYVNGPMINIHIDSASSGSETANKKNSRSRSSTVSKQATEKKTATQETFARVMDLKRVLPTIPICGYPKANRAIIKATPLKDDAGNPRTDPRGNKLSEYQLLVEGYGLRECMTTSGVRGYKTTSNSVIETLQVLGIEAARSTIVSEIAIVMGDMDIDPRHMQLLADVMTYKGEVLGITRFGLSKMRDSVLQLASFEKTADHLFDAAGMMKSDRVEGVSECIIMGQSIGLGTGGLSVVRRLGLERGRGGVGRKRCVFEESWKKVTGEGVADY
ncbi:MAG: DNA-directed RNA polymerase III subunit RPC1 [Cirrosporium novae-zelandiae]|nr:MAG: DNA-directed RNA polymerase III subunit RPC1 [Cirrosporium novae-zelandiae]